MAAPPIRLMLVDDHEILREGMKFLLEAAGDIVVVAEAATPAEAVKAAVSTRPHVVVMDVRLVDGSGIDTTREIRARVPEARVLILTSFPDEDAMFASLVAGAAGFVLKRINTSELRRSILAVAAGQHLLDPTVTATILARVGRMRIFPSDEKLARLTPVEDKILALIAEGKTNVEIATRVHLSDKTVKNHVSVILDKLEVSRRSEAAAYLARHSTRRD